MDGPKSILVVDDEERNLDLLEFLLKSLGHRAVRAADGSSALGKLAPEIDLVLLDVMMAGMDGYEVARRIRMHQECADVPIIMATVLTSKEDRLRAVEAGANDFIAKPIDKVELKVRMDSLLKIKEARDALKTQQAELEDMVEARTRALRQSESRYRMLVENAPVGLISCSLHGEILDLNGALLEILGSPSREITQQINVLQDSRLVKAGIAADIKRCMNSGEPIVSEYDYTSMWGKRAHLCIHMVPIRNGDGTITGGQAIVEDVTDRKKAESALMESEQRFRAVFETAQDCIFIKDRDLRYTHVNPAMLNLLDMPGSMVVGRTDTDLYGDEQSKTLHEVDVRVLGGQVIESEHSLMLRKGGITISCIKVPMEDSEHNIIGICGIARDVSVYRQRQWNEDAGGGTYVSDSPLMREVIDGLHRVAGIDSTVLLQGESGSGKDYMARYLHEVSHRAGGPFFAINCAALSPELSESELFGHEAGSFTGARGRKRGLLELAEGGTLLLNEIGELSLSLQAKLLTFLDTRSFTRVGGEKSISVNARLVAATNRDLQNEVMSGRFRRDLYYRINVFSIRIPPLRERVEDLPRLVEQLLEGLARKLGMAFTPTISTGCMETLADYHWPGNVRELRNVLERAIILGEGHRIELGNLAGRDRDMTIEETAGWSMAVTLHAGRSLNEVIRDVKAGLIGEALRRTRGRRQQAAELLGVSRDALKHHIRSLGIHS
ncbi:MAG: sigma 54-interacting transcriptional regulator [Desulfomonilaceae bacterium]|nr:sigma 54-interacting transcriptional regulator [Desulfomonilaceae bacterium]